MENVRKYRDIKLVTTERTRKYLLGIEIKRQRYLLVNLSI